MHALACRGSPYSGWLCLCASRVVFLSWYCGLLLSRCCYSVFLVLVAVSFLPWWLGCWRFGPLSPGFPSLRSPRGCLLVFSGPVSVLLVPPSGYMIVFATVRLSYLWHGVSWLIGSCLHSASWQQSLRPCVGLCPLYHGVGVVHVPLAPALRYSPSSGPESLRTPLKLHTPAFLACAAFSLLPLLPSRASALSLFAGFRLPSSPTPLFCLVLSARLVVCGPGWCFWLPLLCDFGLFCLRGLFFGWFGLCGASLCCLAGFSFAFCFCWLRLTSF